MKEYLYSVGMRDNRTDEKMDLRVWAKDSTEATRKVTKALFGYNGEYRWIGTGLIYENNMIIERNTMKKYKAKALILIEGKEMEITIYSLYESEEEAKEGIRHFAAHDYNILKTWIE